MATTVTVTPILKNTVLNGSVEMINKNLDLEVNLNSYINTPNEQHQNLNNESAYINDILKTSNHTITDEKSILNKQNGSKSNESTSSNNGGRFFAIRNWLKQNKWRKKDKAHSTHSTPLAQSKSSNDTLFNSNTVKSANLSPYQFINAINSKLEASKTQKLKLKEKYKTINGDKNVLNSNTDNMICNANTNNSINSTPLLNTSLKLITTSNVQEKSGDAIENNNLIITPLTTNNNNNNSQINNSNNLNSINTTNKVNILINKNAKESQVNDTPAIASSSPKSASSNLTLFICLFI